MLCLDKRVRLVVLLNAARLRSWRCLRVGLIEGPIYPSVLVIWCCVDPPARSNNLTKEIRTSLVNVLVHSLPCFVLDCIAFVCCITLQTSNLSVVDVVPLIVQWLVKFCRDRCVLCNLANLQYWHSRINFWQQINFLVKSNRKDSVSWTLVSVDRCLGLIETLSARSHVLIPGYILPECNTDVCEYSIPK